MEISIQRLSFRVSIAEPFLGKDICRWKAYMNGTRAGVWRILKLFRERQIPITIFAVAQTLEENPRIVDQILKDNHEICSWTKMDKLQRCA